MVMVMGTSTCHLVMAEHTAMVEGMCGVVEDGILPGLFGYEAGQSGVGDIFAWFVDNLVPAEYFEQAEREGIDVHEVLEREAAKLVPGQSGLIALDWMNGNRSVLVDVDLSGMILGATLATKAPEIYRALIEATAFGTRMIIESFEQSGVPVNDIVACGGLPDKNKLLMQIYADVTRREFSIAASSQTPALGSADVRRRGGGRSERRLRQHRGSQCRDGTAARRALHARPGGGGGLRRALRRVQDPARLLRTRRQRRHETAASDPRPSPGGCGRLTAPPEQARLHRAGAASQGRRGFTGRRRTRRFHRAPPEQAASHDH